MGDRWALCRHPGAARRRGEVCPARRPALCQWRCAHRHRPEQDSQRHHHQVQDAARLQRAVYPGLGLPWPADRIQSHPGHAQGGRYRFGRGHHPQGVRRLRAQIHRYPARPVQAARRARGLGQPLSDAHQGIRGGRTAPVRRHRRAGLCLSRQEAGLLEHPVPHRAGGGRGGIQGPRQPERVCEVSPGRASRALPS